MPRTKPSRGRLARLAAPHAAASAADFARPAPRRCRPPGYVPQRMGEIYQSRPDHADILYVYTVYTVYTSYMQNIF